MIDWNQITIYSNLIKFSKEDGYDLSTLKEKRKLVISSSLAATTGRLFNVCLASELELTKKDDWY